VIESKIQINSLGEMNLYLHARRNELKKELNLGIYSTESTDITIGRLQEIKALIEMINL
jgi:hypothetical protein